MNDIIQKYNESVDKFDYFKELSAYNQKNLFFQIKSKEERREILSKLSTKQIVDIINECDISTPQRNYIYSVLSDNQLVEIYYMFDASNRKDLINQLESTKRKAAGIIEKKYNQIDNYFNKIDESKNRIIEAKETIKKEKLDLSYKESNLSLKRITIKSLTDERDKLFKKQMKLLKKTPSRLKFVSKKRNKKLEELNSLLDKKRIELAQLNIEKNALYNSIEESKKKIKFEQNEQSKAKDVIDTSKQKIAEANDTIKDFSISIKNLNKAEKGVLSRKDYKYITKNGELFEKKEENSQEESLVQSETVEPISTPEQVSEAISEVSSEKKGLRVYKIPIKQSKIVNKQTTPEKSVKNVARGIRNMNQVAERYRKYGVAFHETRQIKSSDSKQLKKNRVSKLNREQIIDLHIAGSCCSENKIQQKPEVLHRRRTAFISTSSLGLFFVLIAILILFAFLITR